MLEIVWKAPGSFRFGSYDDAWRVHDDVRFTQRGNDAISAGACRSKIDEQHLIVVVIDDLGQLCSESDEFTARQPAFEDRELKVITPAPHRLEYFPQTFGVANVIANDVGVTHVHVGRTRPRCS